MLPGSNLTKSQILRSSREFDLVFSRPDYRFSVGTFLILAKHNQLLFNRLGMVISKKNVAKAVERNRLKRVIRESFRCQNLVSGLDIVILARKGSAAIENGVIFVSFEEIWRKLNKRVSTKGKIG